jgi:phosphoribosylanthranilate isomerase
MKVKICGITDIDSAMFAAECGVDALGFVFYEKSVRNISAKKAREISAALPPFVSRVGLFVNCSADFVNATCDEALLDIAQIHFEADKSFFELLKVRFLPVIRAKKQDDLLKNNGEFRIVDSFVDGYGGEGKSLNLDWFGDSDNSRTILAGGLTPQNVSQVAKYGFYGVDVSSGVESQKGVKDKRLIKEFIDNCQ